MDNQDEIYTLKQHIHTLHEALGAIAVAIEYVNASNTVSTWALRTTKCELETELYETQNELLELQNDQYHVDLIDAELSLNIAIDNIYKLNEKNSTGISTEPLHEILCSLQDKIKSSITC